MAEVNPTRGLACLKALHAGIRPPHPLGVVVVVVVVVLPAALTADMVPLLPACARGIR